MFFYVYDGSFEGLLTSIYEAYYSKEKPEKIVKNTEFEPSLIHIPIHIKTDKIKYEKVYFAIKNKISNEVLQYIYYAFLSELKDCSNLIYNYVKLGFKLGKNVTEHLYLDSVSKLQNTSRKVETETHRMLGFLRFVQIDTNTYYSPMEPDHNILVLICPHFAERLANENWIIHDIKRNLAALYNKKEWIITNFQNEEFSSLNIRDKEELYERLWKDYFKATTIENRVNFKSQRGKMPVRYHKYLTELNNP